MHRFLKICLLVLTTSAIQSEAATPTAPINVKLSVPSLKEVTLNPTSLAGGATATGTITLQQPAGSGGVTVKLQSSAPSIAAVPPSAVIQPGSASAFFLLQSYPVAVNPNVVGNPPSVQISASIGTAAPKTATLTVRPPTLASFAFNPSSVPGGTAGTGTIGITSPAPAGGLTVNISTGGTGSGSGTDPRTSIRLVAPPVTLPQSVTVPAAATSANFSVPTKPVLTVTPVQVVAAYGPFISKTASLTVLPPAVGSFTVIPAPNNAGVHPFQGGQQGTGKLTLTAQAPSQGMSIPLSVTEHVCPSCAVKVCGPLPSMPASVQIAGGSTTANFPITTFPGEGFHVLNASDKKALIFIRDAFVGSDSLIFPSSVKGGTIVNARLKLVGTVSACGHAGRYKLQSSNTTLAQVPAEVMVPMGSGEGTFSFTTTAVASQQTVEISVYDDSSGTPTWRKKSLTLTP